MSAISGIWSFSQKRDIASDLERMCNAQKIYSNTPPLKWIGPNVGLAYQAHTAGTSTGPDRQPVSIRDGRTLVFADARIDNQHEIGERLGLDRSDQYSDCQLVALAYQRDEEGAFDYLLGDYCLAVFDTNSKSLRLFRDPLGGRPLHWFRNEDCFAFSSMPKGLHALDFVPYAPNPDYFLRGLALIQPERHATCFQGIMRLDAGEQMTITPDRCTQATFWQPPESQTRFRKPVDYVDAIRAEFDRAVRVRLRGARRVGTHLSGGLDSSSVAATAAREAGPTQIIDTYTSVPRSGAHLPDASGRFADESAHAKQTAFLYPNLKHHLVEAPDTDPLAELESFQYYCDHPAAAVGNLAWMDEINRQAQANGIDVLLTGDAGNTTVSHDGRDAPYLLCKQGRFIDAVTLSWRSAAKGHMKKRHLPVILVSPTLPFSYAKITRLVAAKASGKSHTDYYVNPSRSLRVKDDPSYRHLFPDYSTGNPWRERLGTYTLTPLAYYRKGVLARRGIDLRDPFTDRRLIELCASMPPEIFLLDGVPRGLARALFADRLPATTVNEFRRGLQAADWVYNFSGREGDISEEVDRIAKSRIASDLLNMDQMKIAAKKKINASTNPSILTDYRIRFLRSFSVGHFIRKVEGTN